MYYQEKLEEYERLVQVRNDLQKIQDEIESDIKNKFNQIAVVEDKLTLIRCLLEE